GLVMGRARARPPFWPGRFSGVRVPYSGDSSATRRSCGAGIRACALLEADEMAKESRAKPESATSDTIVATAEAVGNLVRGHGLERRCKIGVLIVANLSPRTR